MLNPTRTIQKQANTSDLSVLAYANNFTMWHYITKDHNKETVFSKGYFNKQKDMLRVGDLLILNLIDENTNAWVVTNDADGVRIS